MPCWRQGFAKPRVLVARLREENQLLVQENEQLCARIAELEEDLQHARRPEPESALNLDHLIEQLDTLHQLDSPPIVEQVEAYEPEAGNGRARRRAASRGTADGRRLLSTRRVVHERRGQFESAVQIYQQLLEADDNNLEVAQRLAFLLEKLDRRRGGRPVVGQNLDHAGGPVQPAALVALTAVPLMFVTPLHDVFQRDCRPTTAPERYRPEASIPCKFMARLWENTNADMRASCVERCCVDLGIV